MSQSVQELLYELNSQRVRKMRTEIREQYKATDVERQERNDAREAEQFGEKAKLASGLHLLDLKRAGHSPRRTEYVISSERYLVAGHMLIRARLLAQGSLIGSPAAMCEAS
jgi:hypothetical protein